MISIVCMCVIAISCIGHVCYSWGLISLMKMRYLGSMSMYTGKYPGSLIWHSIAAKSKSFWYHRPNKYTTLSTGNCILTNTYTPNYNYNAYSNISTNSKKAKELYKVSNKLIQYLSIKRDHYHHGYRNLYNWKDTKTVWSKYETI